MKRTAQKGSVLLVTLVMLVVMTLVGLAGIEVTGLEEKMVLNMRDRQVAFEAAEAAMAQLDDFFNGTQDIVSGVTLDDLRDVQSTGDAQGFYGIGQEDTCNKSDSGEGSDSEESESEDSSDTSSIAEKDWSSGCDIAFTSNYQKAFKHLSEMPTFIFEEVLSDNRDDSEEYGHVSDKDKYYRVTVKAKGLTDASEVRIQTIYKLYVSKQSQ